MMATEPTFDIQQVFDVGDGPELGLHCSNCGYTHSRPIQMLLHLTGQHLGCPKCAVVQLVPMIQEMRP